MNKKNLIYGNVFECTASTGKRSDQKKREMKS